MSKEKQIEEMALEEAILHARETAETRTDLCDKCRKEHEQLALWLEELKGYREGYPKQSEGEWIWTENGEADHEKYWVCSVCKEHDFVRTKYCPNCGSKMKGEKE